jgi:hypothetical protein
MATLYGFPANKGHDSSPYEALFAYIAQQNSAALYLSATGSTLAANQTISAGHKHDVSAAFPDWRQAGSWRPTADTDVSNREGYVVESTSFVEFAVVPLRFPLESGGDPVDGTLTPRARISLPAAGTSTDTTLTIECTFYKLPGLLDTGVLTTTISPGAALSITATSPATITNSWVAGSAITFGDSDINTADGDVVAIFKAKVADSGAKATIFELALTY